MSDAEDKTRQWPGSPYTDDEVRERIKASAEMGKEAFLSRGGFSTENAIYLSFSDASRPKGTQWLGGCYIPADTLHEALALSHGLRINPGGSVRITGPFPAQALRDGYANRLLTTEEDINLAVDDTKL